MEKSAKAFGSAKTFGEMYASDMSCIRHITQSSLTVPGQARDLGSLLASSKFTGGMIPRHGTPQYDADEATALARLRLESMDDEALESFVKGAQAPKPDAKKEDESSQDDADKTEEGA